MLGRTLSVVTLGQERTALSDNYIKVELAYPRGSNLLVDVVVGDLASKGVRERGVFRVI
jgi:hypothetical protein